MHTHKHESVLKVIKKTYHLSATLMGVVKHEVKRSAGRSGFMGKCSVEPQAASRMLFLMLDGALCSALVCDEVWAEVCWQVELQGLL